MDEQSIYQKTLRLARLIGLDHASEGTRVWRRDRPHHSVPWRPYERAADLVPIRCWLAGRYPDWRWDYSQSSVIGTLTLPTRNHTYCGAGYGWPENVAFCNAVLEACDAPTPEPSSWTCGCASGWQAATSELHPVGTAARHRSQIQRLSRLRRAARRLAKRKVAKASGRGETIRRLLKELQTSSYAKDWACDEVAKHQGEISRLRFQLQRATADAETYLRIGRERGEKIDKLTDILQRLYDYHDAPAKCNAEYMEAVAEAGDVLQAKDQLADLAEQCDACKPMAFTAEYQKEIDCLRAQLADIDNATKVAMDERCDAYDKHCSCVPLLRAEVKQLRDLIVHANVHSGYRDCGRNQMTTAQKSLYDSVIRDRLGPAQAAERGEP